MSSTLPPDGEFGGGIGPKGSRAPRPDSGPVSIEELMAQRGSGSQGGGPSGPKPPGRQSGNSSAPKPFKGMGEKKGRRGLKALAFLAVAAVAGGVVYQQGLFKSGDKPEADTPQKVAPAAVAIACDQVNKATVHSAVQTAAQAMVKSGAAPSASIVVGCGSKAVTTVVVGTVKGKVPQVAEARYDLASVTKLVVDTAIYRLVYEGKLKTSDPVGKYLPDWKSGDKAKVTVAQLMNHTSGLLGEGNSVESLLGEARAGIGKLTDPEAIERQIIKMPLKYPVGEYHYSNLGYVVLYHVGGVAAGVPEHFNRYMKSALFVPLGMTKTGYLPNKSNPCAPTHPYEDPSATLSCSSRDLLARKTNEVTGHAGLFSTASDMSLLARMLVNGGQYGGKRYLNADDVARMSKPQSAKNAYGSAVWTNSKGRFGGLSKTAFAGYGDTGATVSVDPASHLWVVVLNNSSPTTDEASVAIKKAVAAVNTAAINAARAKK